ncbi:MAG: YlxR family protein [Clostridiales bacterium]|nr:YlxR family protein [Clostridiales bacterium]
MGVTKKIPERMCVVCRQMKPKAELIRIVNSEDGVTVDKTGKLGGRGVYLCKCKECITKALKNKGFVKQHGFSLENVAQELENLIEQ